MSSGSQTPVWERADKGISMPAGPYIYTFDGDKFTFTKDAKELYFDCGPCLMGAK
jgi:hypothetical protein